jgi:hypothetical protein
MSPQIHSVTLTICIFFIIKELCHSFNMPEIFSVFRVSPAIIFLIPVNSFNIIGIIFNHGRQNEKEIFNSSVGLAAISYPADIRGAELGWTT